jgi:hypothetical protein
MKGTKKVTIDGKAYAFKFDLNALERFTEEAGVGLNGLDEALDKVANINSDLLPLVFGKWNLFKDVKI